MGADGTVTWQKGALGLLGVTLTACFTWASAPPWHVWAFGWVTLIPAMLVTRQGGKRGLAWSVLAAVLVQGFVFSWIPDTITRFSELPDSVAWVALGLFGLVFGWPIVLYLVGAWWIRPRAGLHWLWLWPCFVVVVDALAQRAVLFPYGLGATQLTSPVHQVASIFGTYGLSWMVACFQALVVESVLQWRAGRPWPRRELLSFAGAWLLIAGWSTWRASWIDRVLSEGPHLRMGQIQSGWSMEDRARVGAREAWRYWLRSTADLAREGAELVVWPEGAAPYPLNDTPATIVLWELTEDLGVDQVVGSDAVEVAVQANQAGGLRQVFYNTTYGFANARLQAADDVLSPQALWEQLQADGCALDTHHVVTRLETAALLAVVGESEAQSPCARQIARRASELAAQSEISEAVYQAHAAELWPRVRTLTRGFSAPLRERTVWQDRGEFYWVLDEATCESHGCRGLWLHSTAEALRVFPEPSRYDKQMPLPFGEYMPFAETFPEIESWIGRAGGTFRAGTHANLLDVAGVQAGTPICYEGIMDAVCRAFEGATMLINVTNDAWFGDSSESDLHGMLVAARAVELGIPVFRSTYSGVSFVALPSGRVAHRAELFKPVSRVVEVARTTVPTVYRRVGDVLVYLSLGACAGALLRKRERQND